MSNKQKVFIVEIIPLVLDMCITRIVVLKIDTYKLLQIC